MSSGSKPQASATRSKLKLSGSAINESKVKMNPISAQGEITPPKGSFPHRRPSAPSANPDPTNPNASSDAVDLTGHPLYSKVKSLTSDLALFLNHDWETNSTYKLTKLKYYAIMYHFDHETSARPTQSKDILKDKFKKNLLPKLLPFCLPPPPPPEDSMETDDGSNEDYDPLNRRTTIAMLVDTIMKINRRAKVSSVALKDEVLALYKHYVNPDLPLPDSQFTKRPRTVRSKFVPKLSIQVIRHTLQSYNPEVFLNIPVLRLPNYISLYRKFILEEAPNSEEEELVAGYHYWINKDMLKEDST